MKQALAAPVIPVPESTRERARETRPRRMKNGVNNGTRLEAVRPGDVLTLQALPVPRPVVAMRRRTMVTLELDDAPERPLTLIGVAAMAVSVEPQPRQRGHAGASPTAGKFPVAGDTPV